MKKDIGFFTKLLLKILTKLQEVTLKSEYRGLYLKLTKLHFKLYFGANLLDSMVNDTKDFQVAQSRHGNMVVSLLYPKADNKVKYSIKKAAMAALKKDLLLEVKL
jgi:hypothetical protein